MKSPLAHLDRVLENRIRLAVMASLVVSESMDFPTLKDMLEVTDGNLATHASVLERAGYIRVRKHFRGRKPVTTYSATETGRKAFARHVDALEDLLRKGR